MEWRESALELAEGADVLVVLTEWNEFRTLDLKRVREVLLGNVLVDLRNVYPESFAEEAAPLLRYRPDVATRDPEAQYQSPRSARTHPLI